MIWMSFWHVGYNKLTGVFQPQYSSKYSVYFSASFATNNPLNYLIKKNGEKKSHLFSLHTFKWSRDLSCFDPWLSVWRKKVVMLLHFPSNFLDPIIIWWWVTLSTLISIIKRWLSASLINGSNFCGKSVKCLWLPNLQKAQKEKIFLLAIGSQP